MFPRTGNPQYVYTIASKKTKLGLSDNMRYIWVDYRDGTVNYGNLRKFEYFSNDNFPVSKARIPLARAKCEMMEGGRKIVKIEEEEGDKQEWVFIFANEGVAEEFLKAITISKTAMGDIGKKIITKTN